MDRVSIQLRAEGVDHVRAALRGVRAASVEADEASNASTAAGAKKRTAARQKEVDEWKALVNKMRREEAFTSAIGGGSRGNRDALVGSSSGPGSLDRILSAFSGGEGLGGMLKAAGVAGLAILTLKGGIDLAANALKSFAGFVLSDVVKPEWALGTRAQQFANDIEEGGPNAETIAGRARAAGLKNNMGAEDVLGIAEQFKRTTGGHGGLALDMAETLATISKGRGLDKGMLADFAGGIYRPGMGAGDLRQSLLTLIGQGTKGGVGIGSLAELGPHAMASAEGFAGDRRTQVAELGALIQTSRRGFGTARAAAGGIEEFVEQTLKRGAAGTVVTTAGGGTQIADAAKLIGDLYRQTSGNAAALKGLGYEGGAAKLVGAYRETYENAYGASRASGKGDQAAREEGAGAVTAFIRSLMVASTTMGAEESKRNAVMATTGQRWEAAIEQIKAKLLEAMPAINQFAGELVKQAPAIANAALLLANVLISLAHAAKAVVDFLGILTGPAGGPGEKGGKYEIDPTTGKFHFKASEGNAEEQKLFGNLWQLPPELQAKMATAAGQQAAAPQVTVGSALPLPAGGPPVVPPLPSFGSAAPFGPPLPPALPAPTASTEPSGPAELHAATQKAAGSVDALRKAIDDLVASTGGLNRTKPFTDHH